MAGCTFDSQNYVGAYQSGFVVVVNGSYIAAPDGGIIWTDLNAAEQRWNQLEGCGPPSGGGCTMGGNCFAPNSCVNGVCTAPAPGGGGGGTPVTCPTGQIAILGKCYPQQEVLIVGGIALLLLLRRH